jgi:hypothetical protein
LRLRRLRSLDRKREQLCLGFPQAGLNPGKELRMFRKNELGIPTKTIKRWLDFP